MPDDDLLLVEELRAIWDRVPIPHGEWHPGAAAIARLDADVRDAFAVLAEDGDARAGLRRVLEGDVPATAELGGALARLRELPRPDGKHPYLADVLPGLEAAEAVLAAVQRAPASTP
jgi:hypothetical protein